MRTYYAWFKKPAHQHINTRLEGVEEGPRPYQRKGDSHDCPGGRRRSCISNQWLHGPQDFCRDDWGLVSGCSSLNGYDKPVSNFRRSWSVFRSQGRWFCLDMRDLSLASLLLFWLCRGHQHPCTLTRSIHGDSGKLICSTISTTISVERLK